MVYCDFSNSLYKQKIRLSEMQIILQRYMMLKNMLSIQRKIAF